MNNIVFLIVWCILTASCSGCSASKPQTVQHNQQNNPRMAHLIKSMATGHVKSGNYGGSTQYEIFPSVYHYTYFDASSEKNKDLKQQFQQLVEDYLQNITVNNSVSLNEYLTYLYQNNTEKLNEVHRANQEKRPVGNSNQPLPTLFFIDDAAQTVLRLDPYSTELNWNESTVKLNEFLQKNATHFKSEIPDAFYNKYYK